MVSSVPSTRLNTMASAAATSVLVMPMRIWRHTGRNCSSPGQNSGDHRSGVELPGLVEPQGGEHSSATKTRTETTEMIRARRRARGPGAS